MLHVPVLPHRNLSLCSCLVSLSICKSVHGVMCMFNDCKLSSCNKDSTGLPAQTSSLNFHMGLFFGNASQVLIQQKAVTHSSSMQMLSRRASYQISAVLVSSLLSLTHVSQGSPKLGTPAISIERLTIDFSCLLPHLPSAGLPRPSMRTRRGSLPPPGLVSSNPSGMGLLPVRTLMLRMMRAKYADRSRTLCVASVQIIRRHLHIVTAVHCMPKAIEIRSCHGSGLVT